MNFLSLRVSKLIFLSIMLLVLLNCSDKSNNVWKSQTSELQLTFNQNWKLISPVLDTENKTIVGVTDNSDNASLVLKIVDDFPGNVLSTSDYSEVLKSQMLSANAKNKFHIEDEITFKEMIFQRMIFSMHTKFGELTMHVYTNRNGKKLTGIQMAFPPDKNLKNVTQLPSKMQELLDGLII